MAKKNLSFEASIERLEEILHTLESGNETLDTSLKLYEEGIALIRSCSSLLEDAEQSVKMLRLQADGKAVLEDFNQSEGEEE